MVLLETKVTSSLATSSGTEKELISPDDIARYAGKKVIIDLVTPETPKNQGINVTTPPTIKYTPPRKVHMDENIWYRGDGSSVDMADISPIDEAPTQHPASPVRSLFKEKRSLATSNANVTAPPPAKKKKIPRKINSLEESSSD